MTPAPSSRATQPAVRHSRSFVAGYSTRGKTQSLLRRGLLNPRYDAVAPSSRATRFAAHHSRSFVAGYSIRGRKRLDVEVGGVRSAGTHLRGNAREAGVGGRIR